MGGTILLSTSYCPNAEATSSGNIIAPSITLQRRPSFASGTASDSNTNSPHSGSGANSPVSPLSLEGPTGHYVQFRSESRLQQIKAEEAATRPRTPSDLGAKTPPTEGKLPPRPPKRTSLPPLPPPPPLPAHVFDSPPSSNSGSSTEFLEISPHSKHMGLLDFSAGTALYETTNWSTVFTCLLPFDAADQKFHERDHSKRENEAHVHVTAPLSTADVSSEHAVKPRPARKSRRAKQPRRARSKVVSSIEAEPQPQPHSPSASPLGPRRAKDRLKRVSSRLVSTSTPPSPNLIVESVCTPPAMPDDQSPLLTSAAHTNGSADTITLESSAISASDSEPLRLDADATANIVDQASSLALTATTVHSTKSTPKQQRRRKLGLKATAARLEVLQEASLSSALSHSPAMIAHVASPLPLKSTLRAARLVLHGPETMQSPPSTKTSSPRTAHRSRLSAVRNLLNPMFATARAAFKILVVDDNVVNQKLLCRILATKGFKSLDTAINGLIATQMVASHMRISAPSASDVDSKPHENKEANGITHSNGAYYGCIFMDYDMPVMDGMEASRRIIAMNFTSPIICVTAAATLDVQREATNAGMRPTVLTKPLDADKLFNELSQLPPFKDLLSL
jgi:CheY-like chemotaxis protein